ncbi:hypothetical protein ACFQ9Z_36800 [Streptomyces sp. NPDC056580]|uniref:hypothetical protein n=1 Tax=Streptomyces sp. NPDC056580 TaxID=3345872 RepID=UPI0036CADBF8
MAALPKGGVLVSWLLRSRTGASAQLTTATGVRTSPLTSSCRVLGGTLALEEQFPYPSKKNVVLSAHACLASPDDVVVDQTIAVLNSSHLRGVRG